MYYLHDWIYILSISSRYNAILLLSYAPIIILCGQNSFSSSCILREAEGAVVRESPDGILS